MSASDNCKDGASKLCDGVCEVNDMLQNMSTSDEDNTVSVCANCGKEGSSIEINNMCNKCKQVKYCNAACKKKHRHKHKKDCEEYVRLAAEQAAKLHDEKLFKQPPPKGDCSICFQQLPYLASGYRYQTCCGKVICSGCGYAPVYDNQGNKVDSKKCPFCRTPHPKSDEEAVERLKKRSEADDAIAIYNLGVFHQEGLHGFPQDYKKALENWYRAGEIGYANAYNSIGYAYNNGKGVDVDNKEANHYYELAAMRGDETARYNLGLEEMNSGNMDRALKHYTIAAGAGISLSLKRINLLYSLGHATKDDFTKALQLYQAYLGEIKSVQRDKAASSDDKYRYY